MTPDTVLVYRLQCAYWPVWCQKIAADRRLPHVRPRADHVTGARDHKYDLGRVAHFVRELRSRRSLDPISVDTQWFNGSPMGPIIDDGHHRFIAAVVTRKRRILADVGGLVFHRDWLIGKLPLRACKEWT